MTAPLTLLIVEDETPLAEMHAEYIRHIPGFSQILLAGNLAQALTISRTTARRYLEYCASRHLIIAEIVHGKVGRPQRIYHSG